MKPRVLRCAVEDLGLWHPHLYVEPFVVAFTAVTGQYSIPPARFQVACNGVRSRWLGKAFEFTLEATWTEDSIDKAERLRSTMPARSLVELAAVGAALILVHHVVPLGMLNVMQHGDRADYRSSAVQRVLEISGTENPAELGRRHREKVAQALANPYRWDAYVVVCAFGGDEHHIRFSGHRWEESAHAEA